MSGIIDAAGRLVSVTYPTTASAGFQRDLLNRITAVTNKASSGGTAYLTRYAYDPVGNVTNVTDPWGGVTSLEYDRVGRRTKRTLPRQPPCRELLVTELLVSAKAGDGAAESDLQTLIAAGPAPEAAPAGASGGVASSSSPPA